jgi:glycosyltransferase involved in cell wall biosynthesis
MPRISIILPYYNHIKYLSEAINSVFQQSFNDIELIIVNDGSEDDPENIIDRFSSFSKQLKYFKNHHIGLSATLNYGIEQASGEFIARIDADDLWKPEKTAIQLQFMEDNQEISLLGSSVFFIDEKNVLIDDKPGFNNGLGLSHSELVREILRNNVICASSLIFRRNLMNSVDLYDPFFKTSMDYDFLVRVLSVFKGSVLTEKLVFYRISQGMMTVKERKQMIYESTRIRIMALKLLQPSFKEKLHVYKDIISLQLWKNIN